MTGVDRSGRFPRVRNDSDPRIDDRFRGSAVDFCRSNGDNCCITASRARESGSRPRERSAGRGGSKAPTLGMHPATYTLLLLLPLAAQARNRGKGGGKATRGRKRECEHSVCAARQWENVNCVNKCTSPRCFGEVYAAAPLEDGEIDSASALCEVRTPAPLRWRRCRSAQAAPCVCLRVPLTEERVCGC